MCLHDYDAFEHMACQSDSEFHADQYLKVGLFLYMFVFVVLEM